VSENRTNHQLLIHTRIKNASKYATKKKHISNVLTIVIASYKRSINK